MFSASSPNIDFKTQLQAIPVRNEGAERLEVGTDYVVLGVKLQYTGLLKMIAGPLKMRSVRKYRIDGISLDLYRQLDGKLTVENLIDLLIEREKLSFFEARALLSQYLNSLTRRGLVAIAVKEPDAQ